MFSEVVRDFREKIMLILPGLILLIFIGIEVDRKENGRNR